MAEFFALDDGLQSLSGNSNVTVTNPFGVVDPVVVPATVVAGNQTVYKMMGYFAATNTWEVWTSTGSPNTSPPSGHTLTFISFFVIS